MLVNYVLVCIIIMSVLSFITMGTDKRRAQKGRSRYRIPEKRLWWLAILGGAPGGWLGMVTFRHKTRHTSFQIGFPALAILQVALLGALFFIGG